MLNVLNALLRGLSLLIFGVAFFLTIWIVVPAPTFALLPLGVGAPEVSPWLIVANAIAALLALRYVRKSWLFRVVLACSLFSLTISTLPLLQFSDANQGAAISMETALGADYLHVSQTTVRRVERALAKASERVMAKGWERTAGGDKVPGQTVGFDVAFDLAGLAEPPNRSEPLVLMDVFRGIPEQPVRVTAGIPVAAPDKVPLTLTVYRPPLVSKHPGLYPTIVVIYGGAWQRGSPNDDAPFSRYMAARGYTVVAIDYRHAPQYRFPAQLEDVKTALAYIQQHAEALEVDLERVGWDGAEGLVLTEIGQFTSSRRPARSRGPFELSRRRLRSRFPGESASSAPLGQPLAHDAQKDRIGSPSNWRR